jgi:hypothetical protein
VNLEHADRLRWAREIADINRKMNAAGENG